MLRASCSVRNRVNEWLQFFKQETAVLWTLASAKVGICYRGIFRYALMSVVCNANQDLRGNTLQLR